MRLNPFSRRSSPRLLAKLTERQRTHWQRSMRLLRRSEEHTSELQSQSNIVCRLLLETKETSAARRFPASCGSASRVRLRSLRPSWASPPRFTRLLARSAHSPAPISAGRDHLDVRVSP